MDVQEIWVVTENGHPVLAFDSEEKARDFARKHPKRRTFYCILVS